MLRRLPSWFFVLAALIPCATGCAVNPVSGQRQFTLVSSAQEDQIGREGYPAVVKEYGLYEDPRLQAYVDSVGQRVAHVSHLPNLTWHFTLVDDPAVNAFAMPGGYIYVTRGILAHLNSEAQLAGVLGHEIGHVTARHTARQITQQQLAGLGLGLVSTFVQGFDRYSQAAQTGLQLMFLKYSRDNETQADELGVQYATAAGYDPREIPATYAMLKRVSEQGGSRLPGYLSTHPDPGQREERTRGLANAAVAGKTGLTVRGRDYVLRQNGIVFGRDPREGYFEGEHYYNPSMRFEMSFPGGWKTQDSKTAVMAANGDQTAAMQLDLASAGTRSPSAYVAELERSGRIAGSRGAGETIGGWPAWVGRLLITNAQGQQSALLAAFVRSAPDQMFEVLGRSAQAGDAGESAILGAARSLKPLSDPGRLDAQPDRLKVVPVAKAGDFGPVVTALGTPAAQLETIAILNNAFADQPLRQGELVKVVTAGRHR